MEQYQQQEQRPPESRQQEQQHEGKRELWRGSRSAKLRSQESMPLLGGGDDLFSAPKQLLTQCSDLEGELARLEQLRRQSCASADAEETQQNVQQNQQQQQWQKQQQHQQQQPEASVAQHDQQQQQRHQKGFAEDEERRKETMDHGVGTLGDELQLQQHMQQQLQTIEQLQPWQQQQQRPLNAWDPPSKGSLASQGGSSSPARRSTPESLIPAGWLEQLRNTDTGVADGGGDAYAVSLRSTFAGGADAAGPCPAVIVNVVNPLFFEDCWEQPEVSQTEGPAAAVPAAVAAAAAAATATPLAAEAATAAAASSAGDQLIGQGPADGVACGMDEDEAAMDMADAVNSSLSLLWHELGVVKQALEQEGGEELQAWDEQAHVEDQQASLQLTPPPQQPPLLPQQQPQQAHLQPQQHQQLQQQQQGGLPAHLRQSVPCQDEEQGSQQVVARLSHNSSLGRSSERDEQQPMSFLAQLLQDTPSLTPQQSIRRQTQERLAPLLHQQQQKEQVLHPLPLQDSQQKSSQGTQQPQQPAPMQQVVQWRPLQQRAEHPRLQQQAQQKPCQQELRWQHGLKQQQQKQEEEGQEDQQQQAAVEQQQLQAWELGQVEQPLNQLFHQTAPVTSAPHQAAASWQLHLTAGAPIASGRDSGAACLTDSAAAYRLHESAFGQQDRQVGRGEQHELGDQAPASGSGRDGSPGWMERQKKLVASKQQQRQQQQHHHQQRQEGEACWDQTCQGIGGDAGYGGGFPLGEGQLLWELTEEEQELKTQQHQQHCRGQQQLFSQQRQQGQQQRRGTTASWPAAGPCFDGTGPLSRTMRTVVEVRNAFILKSRPRR